MRAEPESTFASRLRHLRQLAGLSQEELAERAGLTAAAVGALERGDRRYPYPHTVHALADAFDLRAAERAAFLEAVPRRGAAGDLNQDSRAPAAPSSAAQPPAPLIPLVGRQQDIALITGLFQDGSARLVTLTGPPGIGKTRLAAHVAGLARSDFEDGVFWVELGSVQEPDLVSSAIARAAGLTEVSGQSIHDGLAGYLARRHALVVLDNFEHLLAAAASVTALLERCPDLLVLVTSREALRVRGEHQLEVRPLGLPDSDAVASARTVASTEAGALFLQRVRAVLPHFELEKADAHSVAMICARLEGIPLALELAAAQLKYMRPAVLLERLESRLGALDAGPRDVPPRHRGLRAAIAWSYELLPPVEQELFCRLAVFSGGFSPEAIRAVGESPGDDRRTLAALVDKSLVQVRPATHSDDDVRFGMLETVREYALERLVERGEQQRVANHHAAYFCHVAEVAAPFLASAGRESWLRQLDLEWSNMRASLAWSASRGDTCVGLRLAGALTWFWIMRGYITEGTHWTDVLLARPTETCDSDARAGAMHAAAAMAWKREDLGRASRYAADAVALRRVLPGQSELALSLALAGLIATARGHLDEAQQFQEESLAIFRQQDDRWGIAYALSNLGDTLLQQRAYSSARDLYSEGLRRFTDINDAWGRAIVLHTLGAVAWAEGDVRAAREHYAASVALCRALANVENLARGLIGLAAAQLRDGSLDEAERGLVESLTIWRDGGRRAGVSMCLAGLAAVRAARGEFEDAARLFGAAEVQARDAPPVFMVDPALFAEYLAETRRKLGEGRFAAASANGAAAALDAAIADAMLRSGEVANH